MTTSVLMPYGNEACPYRARAYRYVVEHYRREHPEWEFIVGTTAGAWSKGAAVHDAFEHAAGDVVVVADADSFVEPAVLVEAVDRCRDGAPWVMPHRIVYRLSTDETEHVIGGGQPRTTNIVRFPYHGPAGGGVVVLPRSSYVAVNGYDERFEGWGGEDISLAMALHTLTGHHVRLASPLFHLWHPHPAPHGRGCPASEALAGRYKDAVDNRPAMAALVEEHHGPRAPNDPTGHHRPRVEHGAP